MKDLIKIICSVGLVGASGILFSTINSNKNTNDKEAETEQEQNDVQICKEIKNTTMTIDSEKLCSLLEATGMNHNDAVNFVNDVNENAAAEESTVKSEVVNPKFTIIKEEEVKFPDFKNSKNGKNKNKK